PALVEAAAAGPAVSPRPAGRRPRRAAASVTAADVADSPSTEPSGPYVALLAARPGGRHPVTGDQYAGDGGRLQEGPVPPQEPLAALAAQIADIRAKVTYLDAVIDQAGLLAAGDIRRRVSRLTADLGKLASQVEAQGVTLAKALTAGPRAQAPTWV